MLRSPGGAAVRRDPARPPGPRATSEEQAVIEVLRSRHLSLGPARAGVRGGVRGARGRAVTRRAVSSGTAALHLALRAVGVDRGRRGHHVAVLVRGVGQRDPLRARAAGVRGHRPAHAEPRRRRRGGGDHRAHDARCCRCTSSATRPTCPALERHGLPIVEDACEALGAVHADGVAGRRPRPPGRVRLLRQQAAHHRRGRDAHDGLGRAQGERRLRAQPGPRAGHGLARPRPARASTTG